MKIFPSIEQGSEEWHKLRTGYFTTSTLGDWLIEEPRLDLTIKEMTDFLNDIGTPSPKGSKWSDLAALLPADVVAKHTVYTTRRNDAWQNAIEARLYGFAEEQKPERPTWEIERGKRLEPMAREAYEEHQGCKVVTVGFCAHESDDFGNSPDALVPHDHELIEILKEPSASMVPVDGPHTFDLYPEAFARGVELKCHTKDHIRFLRRGGFRDEHSMQVHASMAATGIKEWHLFGYHPELPPLFEVFTWDETTDRVLAGLLKLSEDYWTAYADLKEMHTAEQSRRNKA